MRGDSGTKAYDCRCVKVQVEAENGVVVQPFLVQVTLQVSDEVRA